MDRERERRGIRWKKGTERGDKEKWRKKESNATRTTESLTKKWRTVHILFIPFSRHPIR